MNNKLETLVRKFVNDVNDVLIEDLHSRIEEALGRTPARKAVVYEKGTAKIGTVHSSLGIKRTPAQLDENMRVLLNAISARQGRTLEELGKYLMCNTKALVLPMKRLFDSNKIRTSGKTRATRYYLK